MENDHEAAYIIPEKLEQLLTGLSGGAATYHISNGKAVALYYTDGLPALSGYSPDEYKAIMEKDAFQLVVPEDRSRLLHLIEQAEAAGQFISVSFRIFRKDGRTIWVNMSAKRLEMHSMLLYQVIIMGMPEESRLYYDIANYATNGIYVIGKKNHELLFVNQKLEQNLKKYGVDNVLGCKCYQALMNEAFPCKNCVVACGDGKPHEKYPTGFGKLLSIVSRDIQWQGQEAAVVYINDITRQKEEERRILAIEHNLAIAMQHVGMLYWEYDIHHDTIYVNAAAKDWFGLNDKLKNYPESFLSMGFVAPEFVQPYRDAIQKIKNGEVHTKLDVLMRTLNHDYVWTRLRFTGIKDEDGKPVRAVCTAEVISEYKKLEKIFMTTLRQSNISNWVYDIKRKAIQLNDNSFYAFSRNENNEVPDVPESQIREGICHPDDVEILRRLYRRIDEGERQAEEKLRFLDSRLKEYRWKKCVYTVVEDNAGQPSYAIGSAIDITEQIEQKQKYDAAVEYRNRTQLDGLLLSGHCSVTRDRIIEMNDRTGCRLMERFGSTRSAFFAGIEAMVLDPAKQNEFHKLFTNENMLRNVELGLQEASLTCEIALEPNKKKRLWVTFHIDAVKVPETKNIEGFLTVTDVTATHMQELLLRMVVECDYDYLMVVDIAENRYKLYSASNDESMISTPGSGVYETEIVRYADRYVVPEDRHIAVDEMMLGYLQKVLENRDSYESQLRLRRDDGTITYRRLRFSYLDEEHTQLLVTRSDITNIILEEEKKRKQLSDALSIAEQATKAKTDFLSRMSHDLRTPMNAIIGLTALTLDDARNPDAVIQNMGKLRSTSNFMLNLINDILDMAKIENGAVELHPEPYAYSDFLMNMKTMFAAQCQQKEIELHFKEPQMNPVILVDKTRMNQIFFNIFSNAVKYTPPGGKIDYTVANLQIEGNHLSVDYIIADTGIGMSKEFQAHMFEPFVQEDDRITPELQGTGLGLSITRQLVEMMGGTIQIESDKGKGTTVTVHLSFEMLSANAAVTGGAKDNAVDYKAVLSGKNVLLVEDHPLNAQIARRLLEKQNLNVYYAENGKVAVEKFSASPVGFWFAVLMDIRMPEMDGYTACRTIRAMDRSDGVQVPIIAMTANAYQADVEESKAAGMNAHLAKPIEPEQLYRILAQQAKQPI